MDQFVPDVREEDVERILRRDFPADAWEDLRRRIDQVDHRERNRIVVACMKNAAGDVKRLIGGLDDAAGWYREILGEAEYPHWMKKMFRIEKLSEAEKAQLIEKDKAQYLSWFDRGRL